MHNILDFFSVYHEPSKSPQTIHEKVAPTKLSELYNLGNVGTLQLLKKFKFNGQLFIHGPVGCGKTTITRLFLEHKKTPVIWYDASFIKRSQNYNDNGYIVIDNLESLSDFVSIRDLPMGRVIFICNTEKSLRFKDVIKKSQTIVFKSPQIKQLQTYLLGHVCQFEEYVNIRPELVLSVARSSRGDVRLALTSLDSRFEMIKDIHMDIFDVFKMGIKNSFGEEFLSYATDESIVLSNILYENAPRMSTDIDTIADVYESLSISETFIGNEYHIYTSIVGPMKKLKLPTKLNYGNVWSKISNARIKQAKITTLLTILDFKRCFLQQVDLGILRKLYSLPDLKKMGFDKNQINLIMSLI